MSKDIQTFTALCFECHGCMMASHSALTANGSNQRNFKSKENSFRGPREALSSYWIQLLARCGGRTTLTSRSSPRSLLSANTKLRTTGLLTGWGKVMLPAGLPSVGGTGWQLTGRMERESSPVCHISPPNLIPATISLNNNLLPNWKARSNPAPARRRLSPPKQKVVWHTRGL